MSYLCQSLLDLLIALKGTILDYNLQRLNWTHLMLFLYSILFLLEFLMFFNAALLKQPA